MCSRHLPQWVEGMRLERWAQLWHALRALWSRGYKGYQVYQEIQVMSHFPYFHLVIVLPIITIIYYYLWSAIINIINIYIYILISLRIVSPSWSSCTSRIKKAAAPLVDMNFNRWFAAQKAERTKWTLTLPESHRCTCAHDNVDRIPE